MTCSCCRGKGLCRTITIREFISIREICYKIMGTAKRGFAGRFTTADDYLYVICPGCKGTG